MESSGIKIIVVNKKASFNFFLSDFIEAGLVLTGTEIKSLRERKCSINDAYVVFKHNEAFLLNMNISVYDLGNIFNHDPRRTRKLLLHKSEINKLKKQVEQEGRTLVPLKLYFVKNKAKILLGLCKGKKSFDKRETIKERELNREASKLHKYNYK